MIIAMPEAGAVGFYSDWVTGPKWETFHTVELPGLLAAEYRASDRAAIAGLSMGGLGALGTPRGTRTSTRRSPRSAE